MGDPSIYYPELMFLGTLCAFTVIGVIIGIFFQVLSEKIKQQQKHKIIELERIIKDLEEQ